MNKLNVLITGAGGTTGQSIIKSIRMSELPCRIIASDIDPASAGLYRSDLSCLLPYCHNSEYIHEMIHLLNKEAIDILLIGSTPEVAVLARYAGEIEAASKSKVVVSSDWLPDTLSDKYLTCKLLEKHGAFFPQYADDNSEKEIQLLVDRVGYPLLVKPQRGMGSRGLSVVYSRAELDLALQNATQPVIVQEYLLPDDQECTCIMSHYGFNGPDATIHSFLLGEEILQIEHETGYAFRYTNGIFISEEEFTRLEENRILDSPRSQCEYHF